MDMENYYLSLSGWVIPLCRAIESAGINIKDVEKQCGITFGDFDVEDTQIDIATLTAMIDYCNKVLGRNDFAVILSKHFHPGAFHTLSYAMLSSNNLTEALNTLVCYQRLLSNTSQLSVQEGDNKLIFEMKIPEFELTNKKVLPFNILLSFLSVLMNIARQLLSQRFNPDKLIINYAKPEHDTQYINDFFACDIEFSPTNAVTSLTFDLTLANKKQMGSSSLIAHTYEKMLDEAMVRLSKTDLVYTVKCKIVEKLSSGTPSQQEIAAQIGMSLRNLQRKLHDQDTSYKEILDNLRKKLALDYMSQKHISLNEISYLTGYNCTGNFHRAFKRWTNTSPGEYRNKLKNIEE